MTGLISTVVLALICLFWAVGAYKRLVGLRKQCKKAFAQLGGQLQRRYDAISRLLALIKERMVDETCDALMATLDHAIAATAAAKFTDRAAMREMARAEGQLCTSLGKVRKSLETAADLPHSADVPELIDALSEIEERIAFTWQVYNDAASQYNASRMQFPVRIIAIIFAFGPAHPLGVNASVEERDAFQQ